MYADYLHADLRTQRAMYGRTPPSPHDAWIIWLRGGGESWEHLRAQAGKDMPWVKWTFPSELSGATQELEIPLRFIRPEGAACDTQPGLAAAISAVHAMLTQAEGLGFDPARIVLGGFGQSGALALAAGRTYRKRLAGIATFGSWAAGPAAAAAANATTPIMLCHGTADEVVAHALLRESAQLLRKNGATAVVEHSIAGLGHSSSAEEAELLKDFLQRVLPTLAVEAEAEAPAEPPAPAAQSKSVIKMGGRRSQLEASPPCPPPPKPCVQPIAAMPTSAEKRPADVLGGDAEVSEGEGAWTVVVRNLTDAAQGMSDLDLSLSSDQLSLEVRGRSAPIVVAFPSAVDVETASAKFSKKRHELTVTLRKLQELD